jgi:hypothetical protein
MATAVEVQQLAEARARLTAAAMPAPGLVLGDEAGRLQSLLDEGIAEADVVVAPGELMEVADVEAVGAVALESEHPLDLGDGGALGRGRAPAAIE